MDDQGGVTIVWLRRDLRLLDNPALTEASRLGGPLLPVALWPHDDAAIARTTPGVTLGGGVTAGVGPAGVGPDGGSPDRGSPDRGSPDRGAMTNGLGAARRGAPGAAARWWLARSLIALGDDLRRRESALVVRAADSGPDGAAAAVAGLAVEAGARRVVWARGADPPQRAEDEAVRGALGDADIEALVVPSAALLVAPDAVATSQGGPYKVFTPFWRAVSGGLRPPDPRPAPKVPAAPPVVPAGLSPADLERDAVRPWAAGFGDEWQPGEAGAHARLARLLDDVLPAYADDRDRPDLEGSSHLSPHLHWGELSPRQVWHAVAGRLAEAGFETEAAIGPPSWKEAGPTSGLASGAGDGLARGDAAARGDALARTDALARGDGLARGGGPGLAHGAAAFLRQLGWREFAHHLLWHFPDTVTRPLRGEFAAFPWRDDPGGLVAWQHGVTGYPFVDAAMRSLWATGWMHNRARLVAGSFLVKDLLLPWQAGAAWFWDTLVDADLANNSLGWQWVSGCGADAAPYFRIFNPVTQGRRFDPDGAFVRRWVPELAGLPAEWVHEPWEAPGDVLAAAGVRLGETYPAPIVDHGEARSRALTAYEVVKLSR